MVAPRALWAALVAGVAVASAANAQQWPTGPIAVVIPFASGTTDEFVARTVLDPVGQQVGRPFVLQNHPGKDGTAGVAAVVEAKPDGQTLLLSNSAMSAAAVLHKTLPYDMLHDLAPVAMFGGEPSMLIASPNKGYATLTDLVAAAKASPGQLKFASVGVGTASYFAGERFCLAAGLDVQHVAYPGPAQALTDLAAGRVDFYFVPINPALPLISEGRAAALAVSTPNRLKSLPGLPTLAEAGYALPIYLTWSGLSAPAKTPPDVVAALNAAVVKALALPAVRTKLLRIGIEPAPMTIEQFAAFVADDARSMAKLAKDAHIAPLD